MTILPSKLEDIILLKISLAMKDINKKKYKGYKNYLHNFHKFDGLFMISLLSRIGYCKPQIHKGKLISTKFHLFESKYMLTFLDSLLLMPTSLANLGKSFNIPISSRKGIFPYKLKIVNYLGFVPEYKYFDIDKLTLVEYNVYKSQFGNKIWSFKDESIKYCTLDCISLYKKLVKLNELIYNKYSLNITNYPTLPSLAFGIFRTHYLVPNKDIKTNKDGNPIATKSKVHMLSGEIANRLREGYTGGAVDMYLPKNPPNSNFFSYDVNSLYPSVMFNNKFPIGQPT